MCIVIQRGSGLASPQPWNPAPRFPKGIVGNLVKQIENGSFGKTASTRNLGTKVPASVPGRLQSPLFIRNAATLHLPRAISLPRPAATPPEASPRFTKHSVTGSTTRDLSAIQSRIERRDQTQRQEITTQPMPADQAPPPPPRRSELHPIALLKNTSPALHVTSCNGLDSPESQGATPISLDSGADLSVVVGGLVPADRHIQVGLDDESDAYSDCGSDYGSGWGSDFDSDDEEPALHSPEYFKDLERRLIEALPYLKRNHASDEALTLPDMQSRSGSDIGYASAPVSPSHADAQLPDTVRDIRHEFAFHERALRAFDGMPDDAKQTITAPLSPTFAEMIKRGREALKTRTHPNQPARPTTAMDDLLNQVKNFKLADLKPVDPTAPQINKIRATSIDDGRKVNTADLLRRLMERMDI